MAEPSGSKELPDWIKNHLARYIATDGEDGYLWDASLGGGKGMVPTLLLTTIGRKSGRELTLPLIFGTSGPDYVVVASKGGSDVAPLWYTNLLADPRARIQVGPKVMNARGRVAAQGPRGPVPPGERVVSFAAAVSASSPHPALRRGDPLAQGRRRERLPSRITDAGRDRPPRVGCPAPGTRP